MSIYFQRDPIEQEVDEALHRIVDGATAATCESQRLDFKEEAGRRDSSGAVVRQTADEKATADVLAAAVACMANGGGGAIVLGVSDQGRFIGATLDVDWLRQRLYELLQRMLIVEVKEVVVCSHRLLVLRVPQRWRRSHTSASLRRGWAALVLTTTWLPGLASCSNQSATGPQKPRGSRSQQSE